MTAGNGTSRVRAAIAAVRACAEAVAVGSGAEVGATLSGNETEGLVALRDCRDTDGCAGS